MIPFGLSKLANLANGKYIYKSDSHCMFDYDFDEILLLNRMQQFVEDYNLEVDRFKRKTTSVSVDDFIDYEKIKWDSTLKAHLKQYRYASFGSSHIRTSLYRPFNSQKLYFYRIFIRMNPCRIYWFCITNETKVIMIWLP